MKLQVNFLVLISRVCFFFAGNSTVRTYFFFTVLWLRLVHILHSRTTRKNSCSVGVGTTCVTKPAVSRLLSAIQYTRKNSCSVGVGTTRVTKLAVSRLLSKIQHSFCTCSIGNEPQNILSFFFCRLHNSMSPFVTLKARYQKVLEFLNYFLNVPSAPFSQFCNNFEKWPISKKN